MLPSISALALRLHWLYQAIPIGWAILTVVLLFMFSKQQERGRDIATLHTSVTVLIGITMLAFFVVAGIMPFISIVCGTK